MRLELPDSYKHVADLEADFNITACHIVEDDRPNLPPSATPEERHARGRVTRSLCDKEIDTRPRPKDANNSLGLPRFGTQPRPDANDGSYFDSEGWSAWPGTCTLCSARLARKRTQAPLEVPNYKCQLVLWDGCGRLRSPGDAQRELDKAVASAEEEMRRLNEPERQPAETFTGDL